MSTTQTVQSTHATRVDEYFGLLVKHWVTAMGDHATPTREGMDSMRTIAETLPKVVHDHHCNGELVEALIKHIAVTVADILVSACKLICAAHEQLIDPFSGTGVPIQVKLEINLPNTPSQATQLAIWSLSELKA